MVGAGALPSAFVSGDSRGHYNASLSTDLDDHQSFPDLDWLRIATRKSLQPIARQCLDSAAKFLEQRRRIAPRAAYNFQFQTLTPGSAYDHELPVSVRLEKVFVRFNPMQFGCSAPQIHREDWSG